jgi:hypothetical protein
MSHEVVTSPEAPDRDGAMQAPGYGLPRIRLTRTWVNSGEGGWLKALKMSEYALRKPRRPEKLQDALFPYLDAI